MYCHDIVNPPTEDRRSDINLNLTGSNLISLTRNPPFNELHSELPFETPYSIEISHPNLVGFSGDDATVIVTEFRNLLLSLNLLLNRICIAGRKTHFSNSNVMPDIPQSIGRVRKEDNTYEVRLEDSIIVRDHVSVTIGTQDSVKENDVIHLFKKLQELKRFDMSSDLSIQYVNLNRSLSEYEEAMSTFQVLSIFKHLFNSLEYSVNMDGKDRVNAEFDNHTCNLVKPSPLQKEEVKKWRNLYSRTKHIERDPSDLKKYLEGIKNLGIYILPIRKVCRQLHLKELTQKHR